MPDWHAKPAGGYVDNSVEYGDNVRNFDIEFTALGFKPNTIAGIAGNSYGESGLNPWRWQNDAYAAANGYGLFQFTPSTKYTESGIGGKHPNYSTTEITEGALPEDGAAQCQFVGQNFGGDWVQSAWRPYWSQSDYPELYQKRIEWCKLYGTEELTEHGTIYYITFDQFRDNEMPIDAATFFFLACYEGPAVPNLDIRVRYAEVAAQYIHGTTRSKLPVWLLFELS